MYVLRAAVIVSMVPFLSLILFSAFLTDSTSSLRMLFLASLALLVGVVLMCLLSSRVGVCDVIVGNARPARHFCTKRSKRWTFVKYENVFYK